MTDVPYSGQDGLFKSFLCFMPVFPFILLAPAMPLLGGHPPPIEYPSPKAVEPTEVPECQASVLKLCPSPPLASIPQKVWSSGKNKSNTGLDFESRARWAKPLTLGSRG